MWPGWPPLQAERRPRGLQALDHSVRATTRPRRESPAGHEGGGRWRDEVPPPSAPLVVRILPGGRSLGPLPGAGRRPSRASPSREPDPPGQRPRPAESAGNGGTEAADGQVQAPRLVWSPPSPGGAAAETPRAPHSVRRQVVRKERKRVGRPHGALARSAPPLPIPRAPALREPVPVRAPPGRSGRCEPVPPAPRRHRVCQERARSGRSGRLHRRDRRDLRTARPGRRGPREPQPAAPRPGESPQPGPGHDRRSQRH